MSASFLTLMPSPVRSPSCLKIFCRDLIGMKDGAVVLGAGALQDAHHLQLHVLLGDQELVPHLPLLQLRRFITHHDFEGIGVREPCALLELQEALHLGKGGRIDPEIGGDAAALPLVRVQYRRP